VKIGVLARIGAPLALLAFCALARPASANVLVDLAVGTSAVGPFHNKLVVVPDTRLFFRVATLNRFPASVLSLTEIPLINFSKKEVLLPGRINSRLASVVARNIGTFKVTAHVLFLSPFTGRVFEVSDSVIVVVGTLGPIDGKKDPGSAGGQQQGGTGSQGGQQGGAGSQGGQQGGLGDKKDDLGDLGDKKDDLGDLGDKKGGLGGQQQGGTGSQQQGGSGSQGGQQGGLGGQQGGSGSQGGQQGGTGGKKDDLGGLGKGDPTFQF
jgi:hypothetical protein